MKKKLFSSKEVEKAKKFFKMFIVFQNSKVNIKFFVSIDYAIIEIFVMLFIYILGK
jgi:hypothetical protein